jgi:hypothetical protein
MLTLRRFLFCVAVLACALAGAMPRPVSADASRELQSALSSLRTLSDAQLNSVIVWANNDAPQVTNPTSDVQSVELQILNLRYRDRSAVLTWLSGGGRAALYARGAPDAQIGPPREGIEVARATPSPWREIPLASSTLDQKPVGNIEVLGGFAAVRIDGRGAIACMSFQNLAAQPATRVLVEFTLYSEKGRALGSFSLDRRGTFSQNVSIMSYQNFSTWSTNTIGPRGYADNCASLNSPVASLPLLAADYIAYQIVRVEYADNSAWPGS